MLTDLRKRLCERLRVPRGLSIWRLLGPTLIGVTGGIASGKSAVGKVLALQGVPVIDTDDLSHELTDRPNPTYDRVLARFGKDIVDRKGGPINRRKLGAIVFADEQARRDLEKILHPAIRNLMYERIQLHAEKDVIAVLVPLLFESRMQNLFDEVWTVTVSEEKQLERLMKRDNLTEGQAKLRINAQMPLAKKVAMSTRVVDNSGSLYDTRDHVLAYLKDLREL